MAWWRAQRFEPERYTLRGRIAKGGQGEIYRARCDVVVKRLIRVEDPHHHERIRREFEAARRIVHPNVVKVLDGDFGAAPYIVMEYLRGEPLSERMARARKPHKSLECVRLVLQAMQGVKELHENGLIHRDLKPANIFIRRDRDQEIAVVLDLGAVRFLTRSKHHARTTTGLLIGTRGYMSPEQAAGEVASEPTDIYALGVILYEILVGSLPSENHHPDAAVRPESAVVAALEAAVKRIDRLPAWSSVCELEQVRTRLVEVIGTALAREPANRYPSVAAFSLALERAVGVAESTLTPSDASARPGRPAASVPAALRDRRPPLVPWPVASALLLLLLLAAAAGLQLRMSRVSSVTIGNAQPPQAASGSPSPSASQTPEIRSAIETPVESGEPAGLGRPSAPHAQPNLQHDRQSVAPLRNKKRTAAASVGAPTETEDEVWQRMRALATQGGAGAASPSSR